MVLPALGWFSLTPIVAVSSEPPAPPENGFVIISAVDPSIMIDLRYASANNVAARPLYQPNMPALVRWSVGQRLLVAQKFLRAHGFGLKIWDAYRPQKVQTQLWSVARSHSFVADPSDPIGSLHTRGAAVDATLVDASGRDVAMPTDFDSFTPAAMIHYDGNDPTVRSNLLMLQKAMAHAGFYGLRTEWWHFCAPDWSKYQPVPELRLVQSSARPIL